MFSVDVKQQYNNNNNNPSIQKQEASLLLQVLINLYVKFTTIKVIVKMEEPMTLSEKLSRMILTGKLPLKVGQKFKIAGHGLKRIFIGIDSACWNQPGYCDEAKK